MRVPDSEMLTYPSQDAACNALMALGWTIHVLPSSCGRYAWDVIANPWDVGHASSTTAIIANVARSGTGATTSTGRRTS